MCANPPLRAISGGSSVVERGSKKAHLVFKPMKYVCHSGGCPGSDMEWEREGEKYGVETIAYSFRNHVQEGKNPKILTVNELEEGWFHVKMADKTLRKDVENLELPYMRNLLSRNWFQVKNSDSIFAIGKLVDRQTVHGGTGWAVQMAVDSDKPVFLFLQDAMGGGWFRYMPIVGFESLRGETPILTKNFAGIGTRDINMFGKSAIQRVYKQTFGGIV